MTLARNGISISTTRPYIIGNYSGNTMNDIVTPLQSRSRHFMSGALGTLMGLLLCAGLALRSGLVLGEAATPGAATTPGAAADKDPLETVTVFGSRLQNRTTFDSAVPIDVFKLSDIEAVANSGELGQILQELTPAINMPRASSSGTSDSIRAIQLRGLAPDQTLVLVNGKRWHPNAVMDIEGLFPGTVAVDLNAIPVDAVERIEILRDGAGAQYGSDAIAGVVNIVLKRGSGSGELHASFGENRSAFVPTHRTIVDGENRTLGADGSIPLGDSGFLRFGASYQNRGATNRSGPVSASFASFNSTPADLALDGQVLFQSGDPKVENTGVFYNAEWPLDNGAKLYSFATLNWRSTRGAAFYRYPGDPSNVPAIYPNGFRPVSTGSSRDLGWVGGGKGAIGGWDFDISGRIGTNLFSYGLAHSLNASLGAVSPTQFHVADFVTSQAGLNVDLTRKIDAGLYAPAVFSLGAEWNDEHYHTGAGDPASYAAGANVSNAFGEVIPPGSQGDSGLRPQDVVHLHRSLGAAYAELESDVTSRLLLDLAVRYSNYSDYGSSTTGKFSVRYKLTENFLVRGSLSNSFRAPALAQTGIRFAVLNFNSSGTGLLNNVWLPPNDPLAQLLGAHPLKAETSTNATVGLAWRAAGGWSTTLDFYQIKIANRITPTTQITSFTLPAQNYMSANGLTDIGSVQYLTNSLDTTTRGYDLVIANDTRVSEGKLHASLAFNRNYLHEDRERNPTNLGGTVLIPLEYGSPATKLVLSGEYDTDHWGVHAGATRFGTVYAFSFDSTLPTINGSNVQRYAPEWSIDLEGRWHVGNGLTFSLGGTDVFNRYPDQTVAGSNYGGALPYNYAHPLGINGAYYYVALRKRFAN